MHVFTCSSCIFSSCAYLKQISDGRSRRRGSADHKQINPSAGIFSFAGRGPSEIKRSSAFKSSAP